MHANRIEFKCQFEFDWYSGNDVPFPDLEFESGFVYDFNDIYQQGYLYIDEILIDILALSFTVGINGEICDCDGNLFDECEVCGGDGSSCGGTSGDLNGDGFINVLDVVALVENILSAGEFNPAGDLEEDGVLNVLDIVALVNIILGGG